MAKQTLSPMAQDKAHLEKANFMSCCMKLSDPKGGWPLKFGVIFPENNCRIYLRNEKGDLTVEYIDYESVSKMLGDGWMVD